MIKRLSLLISLVAIGVVLVAAPAEARRGYWHGGGWHGGGWGWGGGVRWGFGPAWGGYYSPYYYGPSYYYRPYPYYAYPRYAYPRSACGSRWIKVRRSGRLVWKRVRIRC